MRCAVFAQGRRFLPNLSLKLFRLEPAEQLLLDFPSLPEELFFAVRETTMNQLIVQIVQDAKKIRHLHEEVFPLVCLRECDLAKRG